MKDHDNTLNRFLTAQQPIYLQVLKELGNGKKTTHWMWFIFPQIEGLGLSTTAKYFSIKNKKEASDYLIHPLLGKRLLECCGIILQIENKSADVTFCFPDNAKLRSCMTLFKSIAPHEKVFEAVLQKYFSGQPDEKTISILQNQL